MPPWRELLWIGICSKKYYDKVGKEKFGKHPVGSGPFRFVERKIGESITLQADPNFRWQEEVPYVDPVTKEEKTKLVERKVDFGTLKFLTVPDDVTRMAMLETGELDLISDILPHNVKRLKRNKQVIIKRESTAPSMFAIAFRPDNYPILKDNTFGEAFYYAINRQEIVDKIFLGEGYPMYMFASRSELGYNPDIAYEFDPDRARQLVKKDPRRNIAVVFTSGEERGLLGSGMLTKDGPIKMDEVVACFNVDTVGGLDHKRAWSVSKSPGVPKQVDFGSQPSLPSDRFRTCAGRGCEGSPRVTPMRGPRWPHPALGGTRSFRWICSTSADSTTGRLSYAGRGSTPTSRRSRRISRRRWSSAVGG